MSTRETTPDRAVSLAAAEADAPDTADIAIVGMATRLPGARDVDEYWRNLCAGVESIAHLSKDDLVAAGLAPQLVHDEHFVPAVSSFAGYELFDAAFFGYTPREAELMDPQHRVLLECAWEALEDAGCRARPDTVVGTYLGAAANTYLLYHVSRRGDFDQMQVNLGNAGDFLATRVAYKLNLTGPSLAVSTACSTSLVAVHLACQALTTGECDVALAGAATVNVSSVHGYRHVHGGILSPDGHCRSFDARAAGTIFGSGVGVVVLKRLSDAVAAGDDIVAVIKGTAINNDGALKAGYTAPSVTGQTEVIAEAYAVAGVSPRTIEYVEAHGTATAIGDPIEVEALTKAFRAQTDDTQFCAIGSAKSNIGHLDAAAGVAGLIKAALAVRHGRIPASLHFSQANPAIDFASSPFYVNTTLREWRGGAHPRRAALSSFGIGGTNAHIVLEQPPAVRPAGAGRPVQLVLLSAKTPAALDAATDRLRRHLDAHPELDVNDVAFTLQTGRQSLAHRRAVVCRGRANLVDLLGEPEPLRARTAEVSGQAAPIAFLFPGQGTQYAQMSRGLYEQEPAFREEIDRSCAILEPHLGRSLRTLLYPSAHDTAAANETLVRTAFAQPALFVVELALARLLVAWGIRPHMMAGHSLGELVAACLSGVIATDDALAIVAARGRAMEAMPAGAMVAVPLGEDRVAAHLDASLGIAAVNAPTACVVSGPLPAIAAFEQRLSAQGIQFERLQTSHAFHSPMMQPAADELARRLRAVKLQAPRIGFVSNVTGTWITAADATSPDYWARQLVAPTRMGEGLQRLIERSPILFEVGPGRVLSNLAQLQRPGVRPTTIQLLRGARQQDDDGVVLWEGLGRAWLAGVDVDWERAHAAARRQRVRLPTYPFERQRHWVERVDLAPAPVATAPACAAVSAPAPSEVCAPAPAPSGTRRDTISAALKDVVGQVCGVDAAAIDVDAPFAQLGLNSMLLLQVNQAVHDRFHVDVPLRQYFEDCSTVAALSAFVDQQMPPEAAPAPVAVQVTQTPTTATATASAIAPPVTVAPAPLAPAAAPLDPLALQLDAITRQLDLLRQAIGAKPASAESLVPTAATPAPVAATAPTSTAAPAHQPFVPYARLNLDANPGFKQRQQEHLASLIARYTARTTKSRDAIEADRRVLANNRTVAGFRLALKEITYPILVREAAGPRFLDVDGNEYVDISMGFGVYLFGHNAPFIQAAVTRELQRGTGLGPYSQDAGHVARRIAELTGVERVAFFNTGTEAIMVAVRLARARTGRPKIAIFAGSFHGTFDGILARPKMAGGRMESAPLAPGIPEHMSDHVLVLEYGSQAALDAIAAHGRDLAAVLVEPVQSRRPDFQPVEFLRQLRDVTAAQGTALVFDEVITGFRIGPGGAQAHFGIRADLVTYGKIIGGGMPIGVVAGASTFMDGIDGGQWTFGDRSYPPNEERRTFVAGTFCQHPLAMSAASAVLDHLGAAGGDLQRRLNERTEALTSRLNAYYADEDVPLQMVRFGSLFRFVPRGDLELLFYHLVDKGIYIWEGRNCFLSTAHTDADIDRIVTAVQESVEELRDGGFLPARTAARAVAADAPAIAAATAPAVDPVPTILSSSVSSASSVVESVAPPIVVPLTDEQKQLWVVTQLSPEASAAYNEGVAIRLRGPFDLDALRWSLQRLYERHEALRTTIDSEGETQRVGPPKPLEVPLVDLTHLTSDAALTEWLATDGSVPFDLANGPLVRASVLVLGRNDHVFVFVVHHIIADDWSRSVLLKELGTLYAARCTGAAVDLPAPVPFREFVAWQQKQLADDSAPAVRGRAFWQERFASMPAAFELPSDRPRLVTRFLPGARMARLLPPALADGLAQLAARRNATPFAVLLSAFSSFLGRLSQERDIVVSMSTTGQPMMNASTLVGQCISMLPLRLTVDPDGSFAGHLAAVRSGLLDAVEHQRSFLAAVVQARQNGVRIPDASVMFNLDRPVEVAGFAPAVPELLAFPGRYAKFDLSLNAIEIDRTLRLEFEYRTDLFDERTIEGWSDQFVALLQDLVAAADPRIGDLSAPSLPAAAMSGTTAADVRIASLFERQAARDPFAPALVAAGETLTYGQIDRAATEVADRLRAFGARVGEIVALDVESARDLPAHLIGVLKAGCAFAQLARTGARAGERRVPADVDIVATVRRGHAAAFDRPSHTGQTSESPRAPRRLAACAMLAEDDASIVLSHQFVAAQCEAIAERLQLRPGDRVSHVGPLGGQLLQAVLPALLAGATLVDFAAASVDLDALCDHVEAQRIAALDVPLGTWRRVSGARSRDGKPPLRVRCLVRGRVPATMAQVERWSPRAFDRAGVCYAYEPARWPIAIGLTPLADRAATDEPLAFPAIDPIGPSRVSVRDPRMQPAFTGAVGELCVEGDALVRTGVQARQRFDGRIQLLAPVDGATVNSRRVNLDEVAGALMQHRRVRDAFVRAVPVPESTRARLVAFCALSGDVASDGLASTATLSHTLQAFLRERLPDYMVPPVSVAVETLPLAEDGSVDEARLPAGDLDVATSHEPSGEVEEQLAAIWRRLLNVAHLGTRDNFFELGGHSLVAIALAAEVRSAFAVPLTLRELFDAPTIAQMAALIDARRGVGVDAAADETELVRVTPHPEDADQPFPLTDVQQAYWVGRTGAFGLGNIATHAYYEVDATGLDLPRFESAWQRLIARHGMLRAIIQPDGQQRILPDVPPYQIVVTDLAGLASDAAAAGLEAIRDRMSHQVIASDRWPLFEIHAARLSGTQIRLYFSFDALILDAWSMQILFRELSLLYHHPEETLPPLDVSYRDYVVTHRELENGAAFREAQEYWARRRTTLPAAPDLPLAQDPGSIDKPRFVRWSGRLDPETWAQLKVRATRSRMTPSIVLLAAYAEVLAMWSKSPQFAINLTLFNRLPLHPQVNDLVGDFTSVTLLAVDGAPQASFAERAHRVQEQFWEDLDHHLVSGVRVLRDMARARQDTSGLQMPVVFTSSLIHGEERADETPMAWLGRVAYSVTQTPQVWLDHEVYEDGRALVFTWDVVANLFPDGVIDGMFDAFTALLQRLAASQEWWDAPWPDVHRQLLPAPQIDLVAHANATDAPIATTLLHTLVAEQARQRPEALAVVSSSRSLTYRELETRARRIGRTLRVMGARPNNCVAVVMAKGWEQVVAVLGILESGAAYLPIDPSLPRERVLFLLEHAQVSLVLTQRAVDESFAWPAHVRRLAVDVDELAHVDASPLDPVQAPEDLAYVIFTSGSTGVPKGVMIDHLGAVNTILDINRRYQVGPADRVLALSSLSFDLSVWDIFGLLAAGGTVVVPDPGTTRDPAHWVSLVTRERVTVWNSVPALMQMLVEYSDAAAAFADGSLRLVLMSGDWIPISLPDRIRALAPDIRLVSLGGATEASIWSILYDIDAIDPAWTSVPYGRPMANQTWHVLDAALEPRPLWTPGQLYIGGIGVAKGYLRDEARTKASFITHPRTGETLYRTGDLGRWLPDGTIEFLGREDTQVKVQGHRIELGEIEAALAQHPSVRSAAVSAIGDRAGEKRLIAYVVPETASSAERRAAITPTSVAGAATPIADPLAQLRFKLSEPGLRSDLERQGVVLPAVNTSSADLTSTYIERRSYRSFAGDRLRLDQVGELVSCLRQWRVPGAPLPKYRYGSAGSLYAVQLYAYVKPDAVDGLDAGLYYYDPRDHRLVSLAASVDNLRDIYAPNDRARFDHAGLSLFLVGDLGVIERLYPDDGLRFALLEAGLMTQLLEQAGPGFDIGLCQIGKIDFARVRHAFALGERHVLLNALVAGAIQPSQRTVAAFLDEAADLVPLVEAARAAEPKAQQTTTEPADLRSVWRTWLQSKVPGYMVPAEFVTMEALPLSSNGKVDRKALPAPRETVEAPRAGFVAARNDLERQLVDVLHSILNVERIGVHDSFFELGGNSVHLVQFHNRLEQLIGGKIPITAVFQHVTLSALAEYLVGMTPATQTDRTEAVASGKQRLAQLLQRRKQ